MSEQAVDAACHGLKDLPVEGEDEQPLRARILERVGQGGDGASSQPREQSIRLNDEARFLRGRWSAHERVAGARLVALRCGGQGS